MINNYKQLEQLEQRKGNYSSYLVQKNQKQYIMHEYKGGKVNEVQLRHFMMLEKVACTHFSHLLCLVEEFELNSNKYFVCEYSDKDLLKLQYLQPKSVFSLSTAIQYTSKIFQNLEQLHSQRYVYRNIRPQVIKIKQNQPYFGDFTYCHYMKRKERMFDIVGCTFYLAPEFFIEDGYGKEVDIWATGVLLFYLITKSYPFKLQGNGQVLETSAKKQFQKKCEGGFQFDQALSQTSNPGGIKSNKYLQDFFRRIFHMDYSERITISEIKKHPLFKDYFPNQISSDMLQEIAQSGNSSIFISKLNNFLGSYELHKEEIIVDFIQGVSEAIDIDCANLILQTLRNKVKFAILKVAMIKLQNLTDVMFGKKKPGFKINEDEWNKIRNSSGFILVKEKIQKTKKIVQVYYKSSYMNLNVTETDALFSMVVPKQFDEIKQLFRSLMSKMFQEVKKKLIDHKNDKKIARKLTQSLARITIIHLVNRIFNEEDLKENLNLYFTWTKGRNNYSLEDLDNWILDQKVSNLTAFIKKITSKYLQ